MTNRLNKHPILKTVAQILATHQIEAYLVGGAVRDILLEQASIVDLDFATPTDGLQAARCVADALGAAYYPLDAERGTGRVVYEIDQADGPHQSIVGQKKYLDFTTFRGDTLAADLADRDFTINAIGLSLTAAPQLIDPLNGQRDLEYGQIRAISETAIERDPIRILRAVRQAIQFSFAIEVKTKQYLQTHAAALSKTSAERQRDELVKLLNTPAPGLAIQMLQALDILPHCLPEVEAMVGVTQSAPHHLDVFNHTAAALTAWEQIQQSQFLDIPNRFQPLVRHYFNQTLAGDLSLQRVMPLALLLHDAGKPATRTEERSEQEHGTATRIRFLGHQQESAKIVQAVLNRFHFSGQVISFVESVVAHHLRPLLLASAASGPSTRAVYRFFRDTSGKGGSAGVAVALHALADHRATYPAHQGQVQEQRLQQVISQLISAYFEQRDKIVDPPLLLTGRDLITMLNLSEGRLIGLLLNRLKEAQATGQVTDQASALDFIKADPDFIRHLAGQT